jgi:hypothetical protein
MKLIRLVVAAAALAAGVAACDAPRLTTPDAPRGVSGRSNDASAPTTTTSTTAPTNPVPGDTTGKSQVVGSGN